MAAWEGGSPRKEQQLLSSEGLGAVLQPTWEASPHTGTGATPKLTTAGTALPHLLPSPPGQPSLPHRAWPWVPTFLGSALEGASMLLGRPRIRGVKPSSKHPCGGRSEGLLPSLSYGPLSK